MDDHDDARCTRRTTLRFAAGCLTGVALRPASASEDAAAQTVPAIRPPDTKPAHPRHADKDLDELRRERRRFQDQELITARAGSFVCNAGDTPAIVWRDAEGVRRLGCTEPLRVRWFDAELRESAAGPDRPGRWGAYVEGVAPNGTPLRRAMTFFCRPPGYFIYWPPEMLLDLPRDGVPAGEEVWREHAAEFGRTSTELLLRTINDSEAGAAMLAGLAEARALGRPPRQEESLAGRNDEYHLSLKLKVLGLKARTLQPPRERAGGPAPELRDGAPAEAGASADAKAKLDAVCRAWAEDTGVGFATLVARRGVILTHAAFGRDAHGQPVTPDYRCDVASITKSLTAILFSQFLDQKFVALDDPVSAAFADYPRDDPRVPTFRQCLTHTAGLSGHGEWGGSRNPHLENILLNGIDANRPGAAYAYTGMGFDLVAKAMEVLTGKTFARLISEHLFRPLGMGDVPLGIASAGARPTARELATLAQWLANGGSYGGREFVSPDTFRSLLPEPLAARFPGISAVEGIGMHWTPHLRPTAAPGSQRPEDFFFSPRTVGHGSLTGCIFLADLERHVVVAQIRQQTGPRYAEWAPKFFAAINSVLAG